jgi:uncharacterized DUF497 family protein
MFIWDEAKRKKVLAEHKIDFDQIYDIFTDQFSLEFEDFQHSTESEIRYGIIGKTAKYGLIILIYTVANEEDIRFITARKAEKWMIKKYEEQRKRF